ncbi:NXPE family member 4-like [Pleurodeles waltl]
MKKKLCLLLLLSGVTLLSFCVQQRLLKFGACLPNSDPESTGEKAEDALNGKLNILPSMNFPKTHLPFVETSQKKVQSNVAELHIKKIIREMDKLVPKVTFTHLDNTTCAGQSQVSILNPKDTYCIGDNVTVKLDMHDYLGNRKKHGGDFLRARIYSPELAAGASGRIIDFGNGSYHVLFTLFWAGKVQISLLLVHPSEAVAGIWRARNTGFNYVSHNAKFTNSMRSVVTNCGFDLDTQEEVCEYMEKKDEYPFYCIKPAQMPCSSLTHMTSVFTQQSYLTDLERPLFHSSRILAEIPHGLKILDVYKCTNSSTPEKEKCRTGMKLQLPGGYFLQNTWHPVSCGMTRFTSQDEINRCLKGKSLRLIGDSTLIQWMTYFTNTLKTLKNLDLYDQGWQRSLLNVDPELNIQIKFQKHGDPFLCTSCSVLENPTIPELIAQVGGNKHTVITFAAGAHFRPFPLHIFIRRVLNIRRAIEELLHRSPETKVILKTENTCYQDNHFEKISDFHGYAQYLIMNSLLQDLDIGIVDAWDMTTAMATNNVHPPANIIENQMNLFLTFLC